MCGCVCFFVDFVVIYFGLFYGYIFLLPPSTRLKRFWVVKRESDENERGERKKYLNNEIENYNNCVHIYDYYSKFGYLQSYTKSDVCVFYVILCKFLHFYILDPHAIALRVNLQLTQIPRGLFAFWPEKKIKIKNKLLVEL